MIEYNAFIDIAKIDFRCPYCKLKYSDNDEKYLKRCNKNKNGFTIKNCGCGNRFGVTYLMQGNIQSFKLNVKVK